MENEILSLNSNTIYSREAKKVDGIFYTPSFLATYLSKKAIQYFENINDLFKVLDPACGDSILLRNFINELQKQDIKHFPKIEGIDKDLNAIANSSVKFAEDSLQMFDSKFIHADALFPISGKNTSDGWKELSKEGTFDLILSNPPWGASMDDYDELALNFNFTLAKGQFDIYDLFVEIIIDNLKSNGLYGLILPDSIFGQEHTNLRRLLSTNTTIHLIARLGEKIFPEIHRACTVIIGKKAIPDNNHQVDCFRLASSYKKKILSKELSLTEVEKKLIHKVPQKRFQENNNFLFDIDIKTNEQDIFDKIQNGALPLKRYIKSTRGAEISKKGIVCQCNKCQSWMPYPKAKKPKCNNCKSTFNVEEVITEKIILSHNGHGNVKLKVGEDLFRFTSISKRWINTTKKGINYKKRSIYEGDKILVRKTGVGITASIDYEGAITNQVVYILKLNPVFENKLTLEFLLAILNSRVMTYFLIKKYGENEWKSHPYLTQSMIGDLPFPNIDFNDKLIQKNISDVTYWIKNEVLNSTEKNISLGVDLNIEKIVAQLFELNKKDYNTIFETLTISEQLIPIKRLLNCSVNDIFEKNGI